MKSALVIAILIIAVVAAALLHNAKISREKDDMDIMAATLKGIEKVLPSDAHLSIQMFGVPGESWLYCRYLLVPRYCKLYRADRPEKVDTLIAITGIHAADSLLHVITDNRKIIWESNDEQYKYYLTCNNR